ncbi:MAG TPA: DUF4390 domain-containing protein [Thermoanaerobaculaceae bacterium]|nr:DUF4390 domain-containing protein [Thermoanaerobaculaceae bacterium]HRS17200.1 DUF4390 domain-containing protein [Thermoanaerobaculaceae bacterium]
MVLAALALAAVAAVPDLEVMVQPSTGRLAVQMAVGRALPDEWTQALAAGAPVSITYRLRLYRNRRLFWDLRLASHELVVKAQRDPLTGVFSLVSEMNGEILASGEVNSLEEAIFWVTHPPTAELALPIRHEPLWLFVRAEFLTRYKLLVIPTTVGTDWVQKAVPESP